MDLGHPGRRGKERGKEGRKKDPTAEVKCLLSQDHTAGQTGVSGESRTLCHTTATVFTWTAAELHPVNPGVTPETWEDTLGCPD